jgi:hypothetical protein
MKSVATFHLVGRTGSKGSLNTTRDIGAKTETNYGLKDEIDTRKDPQATEASRQVGAVELTPSPTAAANVIMIKENAVAANAPATTGVHFKYPVSAACGPAAVSKVMFTDLSAGRRRTAQLE